MRANRPSATAFVVTEGMVVNSHDPRFAPWIDPEVAKWHQDVLRLKPGIGRRLRVSALRFPFFRMLHSLRELATIPGLREHFFLRKNEFEFVSSSFAEAPGHRQVVILGAGWDPLGLHLARKYPGLEVLEIDHPGATPFKEQLSQKIPLPSNLRMIAWDLTEPLDATALLFQWGLRELPTLILAEGVLMYLPKDRALSWITQLTQFPAGSSALFTFMDDHGPEISYRNSTLLTRLWLRLKGENLAWSSTPEALLSDFKRLGFSKVHSYTHDVISRRLDLAALDPAQGELFCRVSSR